MNVLGPDDDGETEIAIVYTDIDPPTCRQKFGADGTEVIAGRLTPKDGEDVDAENDKPADSMVVTEGADEVNLPKINGSRVFWRHRRKL